MIIVFCNSDKGHYITTQLLYTSLSVHRWSILFSGKDQKDLPSDLGSLLYQLLSRPDETSIEQLTPEVIHV